MGHALTRTSPMGTPFRGRCFKCGEEDLGLGAPLLPCPADGIMSDEAALVHAIEGDGDTDYPDPTEADLSAPEFEAIWQAIKSWDISRNPECRTYSGATGNDVMHILRALRSIPPAS
jgi:hypothetical protein